MIDKAKANEAIETMLKNTHVLFDPEKVQEICTAFGVVVPSREYVPDGDRNPKGLTLEDPEAKSAWGLACFELAPAICKQLGLGYPTTLGRGFQVRACCEALAKWVEKA